MTESRNLVSTTDITTIRRRHEKKHFTPAEVISALQHIGGMSPIEMLASGYVNIPAVNDDVTGQASDQATDAIRREFWGTPAGAIV